MGGAEASTSNFMVWKIFVYKAITEVTTSYV
jgi:hypothetical protein